MYARGLEGIGSLGRTEASSEMVSLDEEVLKPCVARGTKERGRSSLAAEDVLVDEESSGISEGRSSGRGEPLQAEDGVVEAPKALSSWWVAMRSRMTTACG